MQKNQNLSEIFLVEGDNGKNLDAYRSSNLKLQ